MQLLCEGAAAKFTPSATPNRADSLARLFSIERRETPAVRLESQQRHPALTDDERRARAGDGDRSRRRSLEPRDQLRTTRFVHEVLLKAGARVLLSPRRAEHRQRSLEVLSLHGLDEPDDFFDQVSITDQRLVIGQIVLTLTDSRGIGQVVFDQPVPKPLGEVVLAGQPLTRLDYEALLGSSPLPIEASDGSGPSTSGA